MALTKITNSAIADDIGLGGNPTTSTQTAGNSTTRIATTAFVSTAVANLVDSAPDTLNTLAELATSIGNNATLSSTLTTSIATKLPLAGGTLTGHLNFGDNVRARFGTGNDLQIYHNANNSFIEDIGTGSLYLRADASVRIQSYGDNNDMIKADKAGAVTLYYNNAAKLATTNTGIDVTGNIGVSGTVDGIDIAARDAVLTSTTTTAGAALPKAGGTMTGGLIVQAATGQLRLQGTSNTNKNVSIFYNESADYGQINVDESGVNQKDLWITGLNLKFGRNTTTERMRIDSSGHVLIGKTSTAFGTAGISLRSEDVIQATRSAEPALEVNRLSTDGEIAGFYKDSARIGSIGVSSGSMYIEGNPATGKVGLTLFGSSIEPRDAGSASNGAVDLGATGSRFKDLHLSSTAYAPLVVANDIKATGSGGISFQTDEGTKRLEISDAGEVGIGLGAYADPRLKIKSAAGGDPAIHFDGSAANRGAQIKFLDNGSLAGGFIDYHHNGDKMKFGAGSSATPTMTVGDQVVGIGTDSPVTSLSLGASNTGISFTGTNTGFNSGKHAGIRGEETGTGHGNLAFDTFAGGSGGGERMVILASGNVGIGTTNPAQNFVVAASTNGIGIELVPGTLNYIQAYNRGTSDYGDLKIDAQTIRFGLDNGAEAARFDSDGRLAIGNTTTAADADIPDNIKLVVAGGVIVGSAAGNDNSFLGYRDIGGLTVLQGSGNYGLRIFDDNSTTPRFQVNRSGNVGIGTASPIEKLDVSGYQGISVNAIIMRIWEAQFLVQWLFLVIILKVIQQAIQLKVLILVIIVV